MSSKYDGDNHSPRNASSLNTVLEIVFREVPFLVSAFPRPAALADPSASPSMRDVTEDRWVTFDAPELRTP